MGADDRYPHNTAMASDINVLMAQITPGGDALEAVDISVADHDATMQDCRFMSTTAGTTITVDVFTKTGGLETSVILPATRFVPISNVRKVYKVGTDAANIILWR